MSYPGGSVCLPVHVEGKPLYIWGLTIKEYKWCIYLIKYIEYQYTVISYTYIQHSLLDKYLSKVVNLAFQNKET
jgi:hypothetical protein